MVATTADLKSLTEALGGPLVSVVSLAPPGENSETFQPRPQDFRKLAAAALVVRIGLDYDMWLDPMLRKAGRPELFKNRPAYVDASMGIAPLEVRAAALDASSGHTHGAGNPHYWLDPHNAIIMAANIAAGLSRVDPAHAQTYESNRARFAALLGQRLPLWQSALSSGSGTPFLAYHDSWSYLARRFRLHIVDIIEPKPGIPPSPARVAALLKTIRSVPIAGILLQAYDERATPQMLADRGATHIIVLASSVGSVPAARDYFSMMDFNIASLRQALKPR